MGVSGPTIGSLRLLRAGALTAPALGLALTAHLVAGGSTPAGPALIGAVVAVGCLATLATGRRLGRRSICFGLAGSQAALHLWFGSTGRDAGCDVGGWIRHGPWSPGHLHGSSVVDCLGTAATTGRAADTSAAVDGVAMLTAHLAAVVLTGLLLGYGETLLWRLLGQLARFFRFSPTTTRPPALTRSPQGWFPSPPPPPAGWRILPARRGPPDGYAPG